MFSTQYTGLRRARHSAAKICAASATLSAPGIGR